MWFRRGQYVCNEHDDDTNLKVEAEPLEWTRREESGDLPPWPRK
jgi:hypothetical protein